MKRIHTHGVSVTLLLLATSPALAQPSFFEPAQHYYKARGAKVTAAWSVDRDAVPLDGVITATLTIRGADNPREIIRPDLSKITDGEGRHPYAERFQIEDAPAPANSSSDAVFVYRLRPRNRGVNKLPNLSFIYNTGKKFGDPFQTTVAKGPKLIVTAAAAPPPPAARVPLIAPEHLFAIEAGSRVLDREPFAPGTSAFVALALGPILAAIGWFAVWRRLYPDGMRLAKRRRSRALRRAIDSIHLSGRSADPPGAIAAASLGYLRARFPIPPGAETPGEIEAALLAHAPPERMAEVEAAVLLLRQCDEARFAPGNDTPLSLAAEAEALLNRWESAA